MILNNQHIMSDRYQTIRSLGKGRAGTVYLGQDMMLGREVMIRRFESIDPAVISDTWKNRFFGAVGSMSRVVHPSILATLDAGVDAQGPYIVNACVKGCPVFDLIRSDKIIPVSFVHQMMIQLLEALSASQERGFFHCHLRSSSVMVSEKENSPGEYYFVLMDLGYKHLLELIAEARTPGQPVVASTSLYEPAFVAPELFEGKPMGVMTSMFMMGQFCYALLAGKHPMFGLPIETAYAKHRVGELPHLRGYRNDIPESFKVWLYKLIEPDWRARPQSVEEALSLMPTMAMLRSNTSEAAIIEPRKMQSTSAIDETPQ